MMRRIDKPILKKSVKLFSICLLCVNILAVTATQGWSEPIPASTPAGSGQPMGPNPLIDPSVDPFANPFIGPMGPMNIPGIGPVQSPFSQPGGSGIQITPAMWQMFQAMLGGGGGSTTFNGRACYQAAFEAVRDAHKELADPKVREAWVKEWEHKFDTTGDLNNEAGTDKAILQMLRSLKQRFDYFLNVERTKEEVKEMDPTMSGIGALMELQGFDEIRKSLPKDAPQADVDKAMVVSDAHPLIIRETIEGSPADKILLPGDIVLKVDGKEIKGMNYKEIIEKVRGKEKTDVVIVVSRKDAAGTASEQTFTLTRAKITAKVVKLKDMGDGISYIAYHDFMSTPGRLEMLQALRKAGKGRAMILDLRGNGGGQVRIAFTVLAYMMRDGLLMSQVSRSGDALYTHEVSVTKDSVLRTSPVEDNPDAKAVVTARRPPLVIPDTMPIIVLVNEYSASASEIVSGCLQFNRRATIVGMPTVGKGVGQIVIELPFGRRLHVTNFEFRPSGVPTDWTGIVPDIQVELPAEFKGPEDDTQLQKALSTAKEQADKVDAMNKQRDDLNKKNKDAFEKYLSTPKP